MEFAKEDEAGGLADAIYGDLAAAMARNSIHHSVSAARFASVAERVLERPAPLPQPRIVVVVGAGASHAASGLPCGADAADGLLEATAGDEKQRKLVKAEIERLVLQFNLEESDFETILLALSKFDRADVLEKLRLIYGRRHHPWFGYEVLAHCLKHRFIDAIVNFNFDEILDQAVEDELGERAFYKVVLDGDCPANLGDWKDTDRNRFKLPLYIKPHGSAGQPSSMRFTRESYTALSDGFVALLNELFSGEQPVYILVLGYGMQSIEFNHLWRRAAEKRARDKRLTFFFVEKRRPELAGLEKRVAREACEHVFPAQSIQIHHALNAIWRLIGGEYRQGYAPRGIERHALVSQLFESRRHGDWRATLAGDYEEKKARRLARYARSRTLVEIALAIAKAKGFMSLEDLVGGRVGTYLRLHQDQNTRAGDGKKDLLISIRDACKVLGLHEYSYGGLVVTLNPHEQWSDEPQRLILKRDDFIKAAGAMAEKALAELYPADRPGGMLDAFMHVLMAMYDGEEVEVTSAEYRDRTLFFENAKVLPTLTALKLRTEEIMTDPAYDWDGIACTPESGEWLLRRRDYKEEILRRRAGIAMVVADRTYDRELKDIYGDRLVAPVRWLPWWLHNRHVTVFLKDGKPRYAISFERRLRTAHIAPLYLSSAADAESAWDSFAAYWLRAKRFELDKRDGHVRAGDLTQAKRDILQDFARARGATPSRLVRWVKSLSAGDRTP